MNVLKIFRGRPHGYARNRCPLALKITALLFLLVVAQQSYGQRFRITIHQQKASMEKVLAQVRRQSGYDVLYSERILGKARPVTVNLDNGTLEQAMEAIFQGQPLTYEIDGRTIVIKEKQAPATTPPQPATAATDNDAAGRIVDFSGKPVPGVTVRTADGKVATMSNTEGNFLLRNVPADATIIISSIGFTTQQLKATTDMGTIRMMESPAKLDEVMVMGYGNTTQRNSTGSLSKVSGAAVARQPQSNPILSLEGQVPGLFITSNAGYAGSQINVVIRGQNSLSTLTTQPLYIIDGVPFGSQQVEQSAGGFQNQTGFSPLNTLNPENIESISVLKDADATAIYGSRGAAGVILITTKKGRAGSTQFSVDVSGGAGKATNTGKMASLAQYLDIRRQAFANDGVTPTATNAPDLVTWPTNTSTNIGKEILGETAHLFNTSFTASGGNAQTQFVFGGRVSSQSSVFHSKTKDNAQQFNLALQHKSTDGKFGLEASVNYSLDNNTIPSYNLYGTTFSLPPNYPLYKADGSLYFAPGYTNPLAAFNIIDNLKSANLVSNATLHYSILPGLDIKASGGYNKIEVNGAIITPASANNPLLNSPQLSVLNNNYIQTYIVEPQVNYHHDFGKHGVSFLLGGTWQETQTVQPFWVYGSFTNLELAKSLSALNIIIKSSDSKDYKYASGFSRLSYNYAGKYLLNFNFRRDGSSRFGADRQFGNFGSIGAGWVFSEESFVKDALPWLSYGKLRGSWGTIGNDRIADYLYEALYFPTSQYGATTGYVPGRIANPYLQWEVTKKTDLALELGFLDSRVLFSANVYRNRSNNLLGYTPLAGQTGFSGFTGNLPATVQNKGIELELTTVNIRRNNFKWTSSVNLTIPRNELVSFPNIEQTSYAYSYVVGKPLSYNPTYHFTGFKDGIATVEDVDHDGVISSGLVAYGKGDRGGAMYADPKLYGGFSNTFNYKGFQLDILIQGTVRNAGRGDLGLAVQPGKGYNIPASLLSLPVKYTATAGSPSDNAWQYYIGSDAAWESAAYLRLRNLSLSYLVRPEWAKAMKMQTLQVYLRAQNILTVTGYKGLDPETFNALPPMKVITAGLKATL